MAELATGGVSGKESEAMDLQTTPSAASTIVTRLATTLSAEGFDEVTATTVGAYEKAVPASHRLIAATVSPESRTHLLSRMLVLIGNDRRAWPKFRAWLDAEPSRKKLAHPFDTWTVETLKNGLRAMPRDKVIDLRFAFEAPPRAFAAQHLAAITGLACRGPAALSVHPVIGPWFALRAALILDIAGEEAAPAEDLCARCDGQPCVKALEVAQQSERQPSRANILKRHEPWLAIRDACPIGRAHRYSDAQIRWHYAHDRGALE